MTDNNAETGAAEPVVIVDDGPLSGFRDLRAIPPVDMPNGDLTGFAQRLKDEIARRQALMPADQSGIHPDIAWSTGAADEWLEVECEVPGCTAGTTVDVSPADPAHDAPPVRAVLDDRGWSLDAQGRDLCPQHSSI